MRDVTSKATLALPFALALAASALGCAPEVPAHPSYANDVHWIMMAHCVRCHGAGDMLITMTLEGIMGRKPLYCYLDRYEGVGTDCDLGLGATNCKQGAKFCGNPMPLGPPPQPQGSLLAGVILPPAGNPVTMPPQPSPHLNSWELDVMRNWLANVDAAGNPAP